MREWTEDAIEKVENVVYLAVAVILLALAAVVLGETVLSFGSLRDAGVIETAAKILDLLLLVFIVVELLYAVRTTLAERELLAEPFLLVGIIASIKEIVVLSVRAPDLVGTKDMDDTLWLMGLLTVTVVVLAAASLLLRRKEREPSEGESSGPDRAKEARQKDASEPDPADGSSS